MHYINIDLFIFNYLLQYKFWILVFNLIYYALQIVEYDYYNKDFFLFFRSYRMQIRLVWLNNIGDNNFT